LRAKRIAVLKINPPGFSRPSGARVLRSRLSQGCAALALGYSRRLPPGANDGGAV